MKKQVDGTDVIGIGEGVSILSKNLRFNVELSIREVQVVLSTAGNIEFYRLHESDSRYGIVFDVLSVFYTSLRRRNGENVEFAFDTFAASRALYRSRRFRT